MSKLSWYWHRLRAMTPGEVLLHTRKKVRQVADTARTSWPDANLTTAGAFPKLPRPEDAPEALRDALRRDVADILAGRWRFFGHLEVQVDDPPRWQFDYLVRRDVESAESAFKLNYRSLTGGVDSKLVWEPSRWNQLVRLAMATHVLGDLRAAEKCVEWLEDWVKRNPPYRGWNWTSALEVGIRLVQFVWIDALLGGKAGLAARMGELRRRILPPHVWHSWRHKSFGSSANNHLLGELVGCLVATARWPELAKCGAPLEELQRLWEHEVLAQFAADGGNKEQALNYQLFSWEFCWQARMALDSAGRKVSAEVDERLRSAAQFFVDVQASGDPWDYGDSDNGFVTPFFADDKKVVAEWHEWFRAPTSGQALEYWMGGSISNFRFQIADSSSVSGKWLQFSESGYVMRCEGDWTARFDLSPLGLGTMAAHGHLDALHVSLWLRGVAMVIDPGTGVYHSDKALRNWLAGRPAHNCPSPVHMVSKPRRIGPFLWESHHRKPNFRGPYPISRSDTSAGQGFGAEWKLGHRKDALSVEIRRSMSLFLKGTVLIDDWAGPVPEGFSTRWQFAPGSGVEDLGNRRYRVTRQGVSMEVQVSADWAEVWCVTKQSQVAEADPDAPLAGTVSPAFRETVWAPYLKLVAHPAPDKSCAFTTTFLASPP